MIQRDRSTRHTSTVLAVAESFLRATPVRLARIEHGDIERHLAELRAAERSADSQYRAFVALRAFFKRLVANGLLGSDPTEGLAVKAPPRAVPLLLSPESVGRLLAASASEPANRSRRTPALSRALAARDRACVELLYVLGLRVSEASASLVLDLDLAARTLHVRRAKRGRVHTLPLPNAAVPALERYVRDARPLLVSGERDRGRLLLTRLGTPVSQVVIGRIVTTAARRAGLARAHPHALRRAVATHLVCAGASVPAVTEFLGHQCIESTARYLEVGRDELRRAVAILERPE